MLGGLFILYRAEPGTSWQPRDRREKRACFIAQHTDSYYSRMIRAYKMETCFIKVTRMIRYGHRVT